MLINSEFALIFHYVKMMDKLIEEHISEFKEAFSLFGSPLIGHLCTMSTHRFVGGSLKSSIDWSQKA